MTKTLTSKDYDKDKTSFTLETDDGTFIRETATYVKGTPATHAEAVTVIAWFHGYYVDKRDTLFNDIKGQEVKLLKNLILACHSGCGVAMRAFVGGRGSSNTAALKGCWCFDCLYTGDDPAFWGKRDAHAATFYAYYKDTATHAKALLKLMGHPGQKEFSEGGNLNVIDNSKKSHYRTASEGFPERLKDVKF